MKKQTTCVVIADSTRAKFLSKNNHDLTPIMATHHAEDEVTIHQDKGASRPGKVSKGIADKGMHSYPSHSDWHRFKKETFATKIAETLNHMASDYDQVILIAAPAVLGHLRQHLSSHVLSKIVHEIDKDLTKAPLKEVQHYVQAPFR